MRIRICGLLATAVAAGAAIAAPAGAHGVGWRVDGAEGAVCVSVGYSDGAALAFAAAEVRDPGDAVAQRGRLDRAGGFCFRPDRAGDWRLIADDGQGHRISARVTVTADQADGALASRPDTAASAAAPTAAGIIAGLSLIANASGGLWLWRARRRRAAAA